jgi:hypothetical protein
VAAGTKTGNRRRSHCRIGWARWRLPWHAVMHSGMDIGDIVRKEIRP